MRLLKQVYVVLLIFIALLSGQSNISDNTFAGGLRANGNIHVWIFLKDKFVRVPKKALSINVSESTHQRRRLRGVADEATIQYLDQAVSADYLQELSLNAVKIRRASRWLNAVSIEATPEQIEHISTLPFVDHIEAVRQVISPIRIQGERIEPRLNPGVVKKQTGLDYGFSYDQLATINVPPVHDLGYSGEGITVLMIDTGYDKSHISITSDRIVAEYDFINNDNETSSTTLIEVVTFQHYHGTYTMTALGGYVPGFLYGPAYRARYLLAKTESVVSEHPGEEDDFVAALEWGEALGADIASASLGYLDWYEYADLDGQTTVTAKGVQIATRLGVTVVTSAGNTRNDPDYPLWGGYIITPADTDSMLAVGAMWADSTLAYFSSHGPTADGRIKPDVTAQGVFVVTGSPDEPNEFTAVSGTSLSAPLVAGSVALLLEAHPTWGPVEVRQALISTASNAASPNNDFGWGIINVYAALRSQEIQPISEINFQMENVYPNPLKLDGITQATIKWNLETRSNIKIDVYNLLGQHIINLYTDSARRPGPGVARWNGLDASGRKVPSGIYFARMQVGAAVQAKKIVVAH